MTARCALYIYGCPENFLESLTTPTVTRILFLKFLMISFPIDPVNVRTKSEDRSFTAAEIITIAVLGGGCEPPILPSWEREGRRESGMVPFERALVSSYKPSIVGILPLSCSSTPNFPTPPPVSPKISPCPHGSRWMAFGRRKAKANCPCNYFLRFPTYVVLSPCHQRYRRTDRQTTCDRKTALCTIQGGPKNGTIFGMP